MEANSTGYYLNQFNDTIEKWIRYLNDYSLGMLCRKPQPDSWSLGQVYIHIIDDTGYFIGQMKTALLKDVNKEKEMHKYARSLFEHDTFPDALLEGPATNTSVRQPNSKEELLQALLSIKEEINRLYLTFDSSNSRGKAEHPGFLFFNALEWLRFAEMHMRHHFRQKERIDERILSDKD